MGESGCLVAGFNLLPGRNTGGLIRGRHPLLVTGETVGFRNSPGFSCQGPGILTGPCRGSLRGGLIVHEWHVIRQDLDRIPCPGHHCDVLGTCYPDNGERNKTGA